jgi:hypothetical protein
VPSRSSGGCSSTLAGSTRTDSWHRCAAPAGAPTHSFAGKFDSRLPLPGVSATDVVQVWLPSPTGISSTAGEGEPSTVPGKLDPGHLA